MAKKYIDTEKLIVELTKMQFELNATYRKPQSDNIVKAISLEYDDVISLVTSLQQEPPEDTDALRAKLVNFLLRNDIQEDKAKYLADRISDTYGAQRYMDGLCDEAKEE